MVIKEGIDAILDDITALGGAVNYALIVLLVYFAKVYLFVELIVGFIAIYIIIILCRLMYFRDRPVKIKHKNIIERLYASSFPSMHSARAAYMFILFSYYFENVYYALILLLLSLTVAYSRVYIKRHYVSDAIVGYAIGIVLGIIVIKSMF